MDQMIWALIIVTGAANVNVSTGYPNKALCEDAISIAKTGMTVIEKKSADEAEKVREAKLDQEFLASHPPRPATKEDEGKCARSTKNSYVSFPGQSNCVIDTDTNITSFARNSLWTNSMGYSIDVSTQIKYAKCVMIDAQR